MNNYGKNQCKKKEHNQHTSVLQLSYYLHVKNSLIISLIFIFLSCEKGHDSKEFIRENSKFLVHLCKMMISPSIFFHFFKILIFGIVSGLKGQKIPKMPQNSVCRASYRRNHLLYDCHLWYTSVNDDIARHFFHFFKILISQI